MNKYEKLKSANQAINQDLHTQTAGRFKRPNKVCVMSTPMRTTDRLREAFINLGKSGYRGGNAGTKFLMCWLLASIKTNLRRTLLHTPPKSTFRDHWNDCFGWLS